MKKKIRMFVCMSILAASASIATAGPAHACINPDEPTCPIVRAACDATGGKYVGKVVDC